MPNGLRVDRSDTSYVMPFTSISRVQLGRSGAGCTCKLTGEQHTLVIQSRSYQQGSLRVTQTRAYTTFIRVLHYHLREKSRAEFVAGMNTRQGMTTAIFFSMSAFLFFFLTSVLPFSLEPVVASMTGAFLTTNLFIWVMKYQFPKPYLPDNIPAGMLPEDGTPALEEEMV